ncbi:MAG: methyltransferase domain-containing protein [Pseudonocardiaceae bacterium]
MTYALQLTEAERERYRLMAEAARAEEQAQWAAAGIVPGARVADIGCGPGAILRLLAEEVGAGGRADGVDLDSGAVIAAAEQVAGLAQASVRVAEAAATGLAPAGYDVVMCRHVLAHNGGHEAAIVAHLVELARPGGAVYLVDSDAAAIRLHPEDPDIADLDARYIELHRCRGNNIRIGPALGALLETAGLAVESFRSGGPVLRVPPQLRMPAWAARDALVAAGLATAKDLSRWTAAFERFDALATRPWLTTAFFVAVGRKPDC